ncbi:MAG TPA: SH3 domain-containing protein [Candidatus Limiplasma sp.]|nr:SH3 domain-containing protein [Candidatus Limiplasma sp.]
MKRILSVIILILLCLSALPAAAWDPSISMPQEDLPAALRYVLEDSALVQAIAVDDGYWYILTQEQNGTRSLRIFKAQGDQYGLQAECIGLPEMNGIKPSLIAGYASVTLAYSEALLYCFEPDYSGTWRLRYVQGRSTYLCMRYWLLEQYIGAGRVLYAQNTSPALADFDPHKYPPELENAQETLNIDGYALVNNENPADRLHLREAPDTDAASKGKYYNGTPVYIQEDLGDWARVTVAGVDGFMMKHYLAIGQDMFNVLTAFPVQYIKESLAGEPLNIYTAPDTESALAGISYDRGAGRNVIFVIGIVGDDWLHVITLDGIAGYMPAANFSPGNG